MGLGLAAGLEPVWVTLGSTVLQIMISKDSRRYRDGWQWPACAVDGDIPMACPHNPREFLWDKWYLSPSQTAGGPVSCTDWHTPVSSCPRIAVPVLSLGDSISQMFSSQGTAVRHRLTGTLSPTRLPFSKQASGTISSEDRLRLRCGPLQMPAENTEIPVKGEIDGRLCSSTGPTLLLTAGKVNQHSTAHLLQSHAGCGVRDTRAGSAN